MIRVNYRDLNFRDQRARTFAAVAALLLCLTGCNFGSNGTGPLETAIPSVSATLTPYPAPPLAPAARAAHDGDYDTAAALYTAALADSSNRCEALYQLGTLYITQAKYQTAVDTLTQAATACPPAFRVQVQLGEAQRYLKNSAAAIAAYNQALALGGGTLDSYLYERMVLAGAPDLETLRKAAELPRYLAGQFLLRNQLASRLLEAGDAAGALQQYNTILSAAQIPTYRAEVELNAARAELAGNARPAAYVRLNRIITESPDAPAALQALILLIDNSQRVELIVRSRINVKNGNYAPVLALLPNAIPTAPADVKPELTVLLGIAQRQTVEDPKVALATFQSVRDTYLNDPQASIAALEQGRTYFNAKDYLSAVNAYITTANAYPNSPEAPEALWRAGYLAQTYLSAAQAVPIYQQLVARFPTTDRAKQGAFDAGLLLAATNPTAAADLFSKTGDARGFLWQGKMLARLNDAANSRIALQRAAQIDPNSFFSQRASDLLNNTQPYQSSGVVNLTQNSEADRAVAEAWMRSTFNLAAAPAALAPALAANGMLQRGTALWALGWTKAARAEFDALHDAQKDDPLAMFQLAVYYQGLGIYRSSIIAAARVILLSKQATTQVPAYLLRLSYPVNYADLTLQEAKRYDVNPLFYAALIRLESLWEADAVSVSDARGLTQVVPLTAGDIFGRLNWPPGFTPDDLFRPIVSLRYGAYYVDFTRTYLGGNLAATLAGYNAGPGAAKGWLTTAGDDIDLLYETITSGQAQDYVRYTYENYTAYRALYGR